MVAFVPFHEPLAALAAPFSDFENVSPAGRILSFGRDWRCVCNSFLLDVAQPGSAITAETGATDVANISPRKNLRPFEVGCRMSGAGDMVQLPQ